MENKKIRNKKIKNSVISTLTFAIIFKTGTALIEINRENEKQKQYEQNEIFRKLDKNNGFGTLTTDFDRKRDTLAPIHGIDFPNRLKYNRKDVEELLAIYLPLVGFKNSTDEVTIQKRDEHIKMLTEKRDEIEMKYQ